MPYMIHDPHSGRCYVTNNPIIYMDCRAWGWQVESRPFADKDCRRIREREQKYGLTNRWEKQLERLYTEELERRLEIGDPGTEIAKMEAEVVEAETMADADGGDRLKLGEAEIVDVGMKETELLHESLEAKKDQVVTVVEEVNVQIWKVDV